MEKTTVPNQQRVNLAKLGIGLKKPNKEAAQKIVKELGEKYPDSAYEFAKLYLHFMPTPPKKPKTVFQWVAMAMAKNDVRHAINYVHVEKARMAATNGMVLHVAPNSDNLEPGYYLANGDLIHGIYDYKYPEIDPVVIEKNPCKYTLDVVDENYSINGALFPRNQVDMTLTPDAELTISDRKLRIDVDDKFSIIGQIK